jgi:hypothetical protein
MKTSKKYIAIIIFIFTLTASTVTLAQTYHIKSFDGKIAKITLNYKMFSKKLSISCSTDTLYLLDYTGTQKIRVIDQRFIEIEYDVLGGTGIVNRNSLILSISKNKIITSLLVNSHFETFSPDKHILYDVKFNFKSDLGKNYQIIADVNNSVHSKKYSSINTNSIEKVNLRFDTNYDVFTSNIANLSQSFKIYKPGDAAGFTEKLIKGEKPEIALGKEHTYLFIDNSWYITSSAHNGSGLLNLVPYSFKINQN